MGVSTGGWCAAMLSVRHPDMYSAAASIAGYYRPALPLSYPIALQEKMSLKYNFGLAESKLTQTIPLYLTASVKDKYSFRETSKFLALQHPHLKITYKELQEGGHNSRVWVSLIPEAFDWLQRNIPM
jgi:S-formylglutathione hydrolase FrmB